MRIKKKDVILEAQLIDSTTEFTPQEKRMLRTLNKKFGAGGMSSDFDRWEGSAFLIEELGLPYDQAYDLALTFWWHGDKLFEETTPIYKKESRGYVFYRTVRQLVASFLKKEEEKIADVDVSWEDPNHIITLEDAFSIPQDITLWDGHKGFTLYIPFNDQYVEGNYVDYKIRNANTIMIYVQFNEYDDKDPKGDTHINVSVDLTLGDSYHRRENRESFMKFDIPMPTPMTKEKIYKIFTDTLKDVLEKIENTVFEVGANEKPPPAESEEENTD